jgi:hypothetical protein
MEMYNNALEDCENFFVKTPGGLFKRQGTRYIGELDHEDSRLIPYLIELTDPVLVELYGNADGNLLCRFYNELGIIKYNGIDFVLSVTGYTFSKMQKCAYIQVGKNLFLFGQGDPLIIRIPSGEGVPPFEFKVQPYTECGPTLRTTTRAILPSSSDLSSEITFHVYDGLKSWQRLVLRSGDPGTENAKYYIDLDLVEIGADDVPTFFAEDVGKTFMVNYAGGSSQPDLIWYFTVTEYVSAHEIKGKVIEDLSPRSNTNGIQQLPVVVKKENWDQEGKPAAVNVIMSKRWYMFAYTGGRGYPKLAALYENRLFLSNTEWDPTTLWGSSRELNDWFSFRPGSSKGSGIVERLSLENSLGGLWLRSSARLFLGTTSGIYGIGAGSEYEQEAVSPDNLTCLKVSSVSSSPIEGIQCGEAVLFVEGSGRRVYEIVLDGSGHYKVNDISLLSDEILKSGITAHTWVSNPLRVYFACLSDGGFVSCAYMKNNSVMGWTRHRLGSNGYGVAHVLDVISTSSTSGDLIWLKVERLFHDRRRAITLECMKYDDDYEKLTSNYYVDCGKSFEKRDRLVQVVRSSHAMIAEEEFYEKDYDWVFEQRGNYNGKWALVSFISFENHDNFYLTRAKSIFGLRRFSPTFDYHGYRQAGYLQVSEVLEIEGELVPSLCLAGDIEGAQFHIDMGIWYKNARLGIDAADGRLFITGLGIVNLKPYSPKYCVIFNARATYRLAGDAPGAARDLSYNSDGEYEYRAFGLFRGGILHGEDYYYLGLRDGSWLFAEDVRSQDLLLGSERMVFVSLDRFTHDFPIMVCISGVPALFSLKEGSTLEVEVGDKVFIDNLNNMDFLNGKRYQVSSKMEPSGQLSLKYDRGPGISEYVSVDISEVGETEEVMRSGDLAVYFSKVEGLGHLRFENVQVNLDGHGVPRNDLVVGEDGTLDLGEDYSGVYMAVGYQYKCLAETVPLRVPSPIVGSTVGLVESQIAVSVILFNSLQGRIGADRNHTVPIEYRTLDALVMEPQAPRTDVFDISVIAGGKKGSRVYIEQTHPSPFNVLCITQEVKVSDDIV